METKFTETEMEKYLQKLGYNIMDNNGNDSVIDSTKVCDIACEQLGFESVADNNTGIITFIKRRK